MTTTLVWLVLVVGALAAGVAIGRRIATSAPPAAATPPGNAPEEAAAPAAPPSVEARSHAEGAEATAVDNLPRALWNLPLGIVVAEADGSVVYRNRVAQGYAEARHGNALVEATIRELIAEANGDRRLERSLDLYGPPRRHLDVKLTPMSPDGRNPGSLVIVEDVTEQHRVDAVRRDFVANVSHELKTPVGAIGILAEALRGEDDPDVVDRLAGRLQSEAIRLGHTIDDLLALSRIESGELFEPVELDLDEIARAAVDRNASAAELRNVIVTAEGDPEPVVVLGDRRQLVSAVGNLVENAIKYSDPGGEVTVAVDRGPDGAEIRVTDRGVGIPKVDLERIFERFYRVDPARSRNTGGTGLGLSIVRHVALNHGGDVTVDSTEGLGSTFSLWLPYSIPLAPPPDDVERSLPEQDATPGRAIAGET